MTEHKTAISKNVSLLMLISVVLFPIHLVAQSEIAKRYGTSGIMDAYFIALAVVSYGPVIYNICVADPFLSLMMKAPSNNEKRQLMNTVFTWTVILGILIITIILSAGLFFITVVAPGFDVESAHLTRTILVLISPCVLLYSLVFLFTSGLATAKRFVVPRLTNLILPLVTFLMVAIFAVDWGVYALIVATMLAVTLQVLILGLRLREVQFKPKLTRRLCNPALGSLARLTAPMFVTALLSGLFVIVDRAAASKIGEGAISALGYGEFLNGKISAFWIAPLSIVAYPYVAEVIHSHKLNDRLLYAFKMMMLLTVPAAFFIGFFGNPILQVLFQRGAFDFDDVHNVSAVLRAFMVGLPINAVQMITYRALIAKGTVRVLVVLVAVVLALKIMLNDLLAARWGPAGIVYLTSGTNWIGVPVCVFTLVRLMQNKGKFLAGLIKDAISILAISLCSLGASWLVWVITGHLMPSQSAWILVIRLCGAGSIFALGVVILAETTGVMSLHSLFQSLFRRER